MVMVVFFHVDDLIVMGNTKQFKEKFLGRFKNSSAHPPNTLLGMKVVQSEGLIHLSLPLHIKKGLEGLGLSDYKPVSTPLTPGLHLKTSDKDDHNNFLALNLNY